MIGSEEAKALRALMLKADRTTVTQVNYKNFPEIAALGIPDAEFLAMSFFEDRLPPSLQDHFALACLVHTNNPNPRPNEMTSYTASVIPRMNIDRIAPQIALALALSLKRSFSAYTDGNSPPKSPSEALKLIEKLDGFLQQFP